MRLKVSKVVISWRGKVWGEGGQISRPGEEASRSLGRAAGVPRRTWGSFTHSPTLLLLCYSLKPSLTTLFKLPSPSSPTCPLPIPDLIFLQGVYHLLTPYRSLL